ATAAYAQLYAAVASQSPRSDIAGLQCSPPSVQDALMQDVRVAAGSACHAPMSTVSNGDRGGAGDCASAQAGGATAAAPLAAQTRHAPLQTTPLVMAALAAVQQQQQQHQQQQTMSAAAAVAAVAAAAAAGVAGAQPQACAQLGGSRPFGGGTSHGGGGGCSGGGVPASLSPLASGHIRDVETYSGGAEGRRRASLNPDADWEFLTRSPSGAAAATTSGGSGGGLTRPQLRHKSSGDGPSWRFQQQQSPAQPNPPPKRLQLQPQLQLLRQQSQPQQSSKLIRPVLSQPPPPHPTIGLTQADDSQRAPEMGAAAMPPPGALKRLPSGGRPGDSGDADTPSPARKRQHH
ncbi:hypothetical protein Vretimale_19136, partial [Volvox reticuliferus]